MTRRPSASAPDNAAMVPFMSLASLLIPMLLMGAQFITLGVIDSRAPAICGGDCHGEPDPELPLHLAVAVTDEGLTVSGNDPSLATPLTLACASGRCAGAQDYDLDGLTEALAALKERHPHARSVVVIPEERVPYEALIAVFDAAGRGPSGELFPEPTLAGAERGM